MKGWLDKYGKEINANEGRSSAPENWVGEGYSNVGRNYSPAWGGQFKEGGDVPKSKKNKVKPPIYTNTPTRADSLFLLNNNKIIQDYLKTGNYHWSKDIPKEKINSKNWKSLFNRAKNFFDNDIPWEIKNKNKRKGKLEDYRRVKGNMIGTTDWATSGGDDYGFPFQYIHPGISPQYKGDLWSNDPVDYPFVYSYGYDNLAITPWDMLKPEQQKERLKKYGPSGTPYDEQPPNKKPVSVQPISIDRKTSTPQLKTIDHPDVQPTGAVPQGKYRVEYYDPELKQETHKNFITQAESDAYADELSKRNMHGVPSVGNITQRVEFAMGGSLPGAVGFTYARTGGIPSNGPYAKKTKASAQTGEIVSQTDPEVDQARQSMFDFYSNRPANLSGDIASGAVQNVNIEEIPLERLQKLNAYGLYYPDTNTIGYNNQTITPEDYLEDPYNELQTLKHEIGHSVYESLPKNEQQIIEESIISPKEFKERFPKGNMTRSWSKYVTKPTEFYTRRNRMFDVFEIDPSQPITDEKAQEMIDFRKWMGSSTSPEEKAELLKNHPNFNKYLENYEGSENKPEISDFMNSIKNDVPTYKRVFNEVTVVPGEQAPVAQNGKKLSYNKWMDKYNLEETPDYNLKRAWELGYVPDETGHLPTVDNKTGQFLKAKGHPTIQKELDWYNSPQGAEFRSKNSIDSSGNFFKYVPKGQNGQEMSYYQHGLDWKPKSISRDGSEVPKNQNAQYQVPSFTMPRAASESTATRFFDPVTKRMVSTATTGQKKEDVAASTKDMGKAKKFEKEEEKKRVAERKSAVAAKDKGQAFTLPSGETKKYEDMDAREKMYVSGKALEQRGRFNEDEESFLDEYINPLNVIGSIAGGLGTAPYEARESDSNLPYLTAIATPLITGAMGFDPLGSAIKFAKNPVTQNVARTLVDIPRAESIKEAIGRVSGIPLKKDLPRMAAQDVKALRQVQEIGRLRATGSRSADQMKYALENNLPEEHFQKVFNRSKEEAQNLLDTGFGEQEAQGSIDLRRRLTELMDRPRTRGRSQSPREMVIENLRTHDDILHGADSEVRNIVGADNLSREDGTVLYDQLSDEQLARLRDHTERITRSYVPGDTDIDIAREPFSIDWNTATDSDVAEAARRWGVSEDQVRSIGERFAIRSDRVQDIVNRYSEFSPQLTPEQIANYRNQIDVDFANTVGRSRTIIPGQERPRIPLSTQFKQDINQGVNKLDKKLENLLINKIQNYPYYPGEVLEKVPSLHLSSEGGLKNVSKKIDFAPEGIKSGDVFTGSTNTSHSSYLPQLKQVFKYTKGDPQFLGYKPMNSLGFLSQYNYSGGDIAKYLNSEIDEQIKRGILPKDVSRPFTKGDNIMLPHYGVKQHKKGGVIKDDRGQWAHPGEITEIGSNQITMQGVPYPVLGISDEGDTQMMYPEQEYKFKGKKVTEYPMAQKGYIQPSSADSARLYNNTMALLDYYGNKKKYKNQGVYPVPYDVTNLNMSSVKDMKERLKDRKKHPFTARRWNNNLNVAGSLIGALAGVDIETDQLDPDYDFKMSDYYQRLSPYQYKQRETADNILDTDSPMALYDTRIKPTREYNYLNVDDRSGPIAGTNPLHGDIVTFYGYDPALIKPWNMLTDKEKALRSGKPNQSSITTVNKKSNPVPNKPQISNSKTTSSKIIQKTQPKKTIPLKPFTGVIEQPEPTLKKKVSKMGPISTQSSYTPSLRTIQHPNIELPGIQMGDYEVSYYSPESKDWANRRFTSQEESDRFAQEMSQRGYPGSYGNVTQTKKTNKKSTGGWLDKYN